MTKPPSGGLVYADLAAAKATIKASISSHLMAQAILTDRSFPVTITLAPSKFDHGVTVKLVSSC